MGVEGCLNNLTRCLFLCPVSTKYFIPLSLCFLRYAEVVVASENSVHKLLELLPGKVLNGEKVDVRPATRQNLSQFEAQARKRECVRVPRGGTWRPSVRWGEVVGLLL